MNSFKRALLIPTLILIAFSIKTHAQPADKVAKQTTNSNVAISKSDGLELGLSDYRVLLDTLSQNEIKQLIADPQKLTEMVLDYHSNRDLAAQARKVGIADRAAVKFEIENLINGLLIRTYVNELVTSTPVPKSIERLAKERYVTTKSKYKLPERRKVSHILFPKINPNTGKLITVEFVKSIRQKIVKSPEEFETYVREYSVDLGTTEQNGKIDQWLSRDGTMVKPFEDAVFELLELGEISAPVSSEYGMHLIRLDAIQSNKQLSFDDVKNDIMNQLLQEKAASVRAAARAKSYPKLPTVNFDALTQALKGRLE